MDNADCHKFYRYLLNEYVESRVSQFRYNYYSKPISSKNSKDFSPSDVKMEIDSASNPVPMAKAMNAVNMLKFSSKDDASDIFEKNMLKSIACGVKHNIEINKFIARETGFLSLLNTNLGNIIDCLRLEDLPSDDYTILSNLGYCDPKSELESMIVNIKSRKDIILRELKNQNTAGKGSKIADKAFDSAISELDHILAALSGVKPSTTLKTKLKKLVHFIKGSAMIGGNIATIVITAGTGIPAIVSVAVGTGEIAEGILKIQEES